MYAEKKIGSRVRATASNIEGTLIKKGFIIGNFMYTILADNGKVYNMYQVELI